MRRCWVLAVAAIATAAGAVQAQGSGRAPLLTRPERTSFRETSSYADVMQLVQELARLSPQLHVTTFGYSFEGRPLPLVVVGHVADAGPEAVRERGGTRVFVMADIHAGEVCGKEAVLLLLRSLAAGEHRTWLDSLVLLFAPIYNADGNERVRLTNRPRQHGPVGGMGQRANAQGLDLNRDHMKLESPEARSLVQLFNEYDPHVVMDLHTTNGTIRAYQLLYAPPLHPDTDPGILTLLRSEWLPAVTRAMRNGHGFKTFYYGNVPRAGSPAERGWYTYDYRPRYSTNYVGLRNRIGILSEAYAYATFEERIAATRAFLEEVIEFAYSHAAHVRRVVEAADERSVVGERLALRATYERGTDSVDILLGEVVEERNPYTGAPMYRQVEVVHPERMPEFGSFRPTELERAPRAYYVPAELTAVVERLDAHGVRWQRVDRARTQRVERFLIDSTTVAGREFQGHRERALFGRYEVVDTTLAVGTVVVPVDQPLGRLVFQLLEPRSGDGLVDWNVLDEWLLHGRVYPIVRDAS